MLEQRREEKSQKSILHPKYTSTNQSGGLMPNSNNQRDKQELKKQTHNQEIFTTVRSAWMVRKLERLCY